MTADGQQIEANETDDDHGAAHFYAAEVFGHFFCKDAVSGIGKGGNQQQQDAPGNTEMHAGAVLPGDIDHAGHRGHDA